MNDLTESVRLHSLYSRVLQSQRRKDSSQSRLVRNSHRKTNGMHASGALPSSQDAPDPTNVEWDTPFKRVVRYR